MFTDEDRDMMDAMVGGLFLGLEALPFDVAQKMFRSLVLMQRGLALALDIAEQCGGTEPDSE